MYELRIYASVERRIRQVLPKFRKVIYNAFEDLKVDPTIGKPLRRELTGSFSYRIGVYRIVYKINKKDKVVTITKFEHRSVVYN
jgi:mRNA-degrading endonuclease RelE of RelBE toxin-antitoxin system